MTVSPKTVLLHIGTTKTGNTSIHRSLVRADSEDRLGDVCYPRWNEEFHQARLAALYCPDELGKMLPSLRERYPESDRAFKRMLKQYRDFVFGELQSSKHAILSAETFSHMFSPRHAARLRADLVSLGFGQFHIVLYVRDPADYYLSSTSQSLRMSDEPPFVRDPGYFRYEFLQIAETWESAFPGSLIVRKYPGDANGDVIDDFSSVLQERFGISLPHIQTRSNTSISAEAMLILDDYRRTFWPDNGGRMTPDTAQLIQFLSTPIPDLPQTRPTLKPEIAAMIRANHRADAEVLNSRYGVDLGLRSCVPKSATPPSDAYRVSDILGSIDPDIVHRLLLGLARVAVSVRTAKPTVLRRFAGRAYRSISSATKPTGRGQRFHAARRHARRYPRPPRERGNRPSRTPRSDRP